jgi:hypothetical protein
MHRSVFSRRKPEYPAKRRSERQPLEFLQEAFIWDAQTGVMVLRCDSSAWGCQQLLLADVG